MIIVEEKHNREAEGGGDKHPLQVEVPKVDYPRPGLRGLERGGDGDASEVGVQDVAADVGEAHP